jgi:uncharacterized protein (TIGR03086 family)
MSTETLARAFATTRNVLNNVKADQLEDPTPCESWKVKDLINHIVGGPYFFAASTQDGQSPGADSGGKDYTAADIVAAFDQGVAAAVAAFDTPGALEKLVTLPFGRMPGAALMGLASTDTFTHAWDLAHATGQDTDLDPELAAQLLAGAKVAIGDGSRGPDGTAPFGPQQPAPDGATEADKLAAFMGRKV